MPSGWTDRRLLDVETPTMSIPVECGKGHETAKHRSLLSLYGYCVTSPIGKDSSSIPCPVDFPQADWVINRSGGWFRDSGSRPVSSLTRKLTRHVRLMTYGDRWAQRVIPAVLQELMRHESINTAMRYYVGRKASTTAAILWAAEGGASLGDQSRVSELGPVEQVRKAR